MRKRELQEHQNKHLQAVGGDWTTRPFKRSKPSAKDIAEADERTDRSDIHANFWMRLNMKGWERVNPETVGFLS